MIQTFQIFLANRAAMHGYGPEEAYLLLNPWYWVVQWSRRLRISTQRWYGHWFGHSRVILRDVNEYGDSISVTRTLCSKEFVVRCDICFIMEITHTTASQHHAQRVYTAIRDEVWRLDKQYRGQSMHADALDNFLEALDDLAARYPR